MSAPVKIFRRGWSGRYALNRRMINVAVRNINATLDLATDLAGAKNLGDFMASYSAYWRKRISNLSAQAEDVRAPSTTQTFSRATERR